MDAPVAGPAMQRAGQYASLGQMGPATQNLLDLAASSTSEGAAIARANIDEVAGEAGEQMSRLLDTSFGGPQAARQVEDVLMETTAPLRERGLRQGVWQISSTIQTRRQVSWKS